MITHKARAKKPMNFVRNNLTRMEQFMYTRADMRTFKGRNYTVPITGTQRARAKVVTKKK